MAESLRCRVGRQPPLEPLPPPPARGRFLFYDGYHESTNGELFEWGMSTLNGEYFNSFVPQSAYENAHMQINVYLVILLVIFLQEY